MAQVLDKSTISQAIKEMVSYGQLFFQKNWNLATSSNYSAVVNADPLQLVMTASGKHKGELTEDDFVIIDDACNVVHQINLQNKFNPSAEAALHVVLARETAAKAVLHTHSVWSTIVSKRYFEQGFVELSDFEMLKALPGIKTHDTTVRIAILDNSQDIDALAEIVAPRLRDGSICHAFLLKGHGLYTWGDSLVQTRNQIEALEFLFEVVGRSGDEK